MPRRVVIDVSQSLPSRAKALSPAAISGVFGGCLPQGGACRSPSDCCPVPGLPPGDYVLCYYYRGHGDFVTGYCSRSSVVYG